ncbi:MAG: hypothetical protein WC483_03925 [Candidatus Paceibacterota bacterium]
MKNNKYDNIRIFSQKNVGNANFYNKFCGDICWVGIMKRLSFEPERKSIHETARPPAGLWGRAKEAAVFGVALLGLGGCASALAGASSTFPQMRNTSSDIQAPTTPLTSTRYTMVAAKDAVSPTASTVEIAGRTLNVVRLDTRLADLDAQTARYREPETIPSQPDGRYANSVLVPGEVRFIVGLIPSSGVRELDIVFPRERDTNSSAPVAGARGVDLTSFASYVRTVAGQEMVRVNFIVETGTFNNNGTTTNYVNAYIFPLNAQGEAITRRGNGEYIIYAATYYSSSAGGSASLLVEPNGRDSLYASR